MITPQQHRKIRAAMMIADVKIARIMEREKVSDTYVTYVITGRRKGYRIRRAIAEECGVPYADLWPDENDQRRAA